MATTAIGRASLAEHPQRGFAVNLGDGGMGVRAVGVASRLNYGARALLFNCAIPGTRVKPAELVGRVGLRLHELVRLLERKHGLR